MNEHENEDKAESKSLLPQQTPPVSRALRTQDASWSDGRGIAPSALRWHDYEGSEEEW